MARPCRALTVSRPTVTPGGIMFPVRMTTSRTAATLVVALAAAAPAATAMPAPENPVVGKSQLRINRSTSDLVTPDARDAASGALIDKRSPDAVDAARPVPASQITAATLTPA